MFTLKICCIKEDIFPSSQYKSNARRLLLFLQREFEKRVDPNDKGAQALLEEMRQHVKKVSRESYSFAIWPKESSPFCLSRRW
jgi:hypothetical protein